MGGNLLGFVILLAASVAAALVVYGLLRRLVETLVTQAAGEPAAQFFVRILLLGLLFVALGDALDTSFELEPGSPFLEYVWRFADGFSSTLIGLSLFLFGYLTLVTILVSTLRRRMDG